MPEKTSFRPGEPTWADLGSRDMDASRAFYGGLFGWEAEEGDPAYGGYTMFTLNGKNVAGMGPLSDEHQPPSWTTYLGVDNADATVEAVKAAGGQAFLEPMDIPEAGRMAVLADPSGVTFAIWQAGGHHGFDLIHEPGSFTWTELASRDEEGAQKFYGTIFGWDAHVSPGYTEFHLAGESVAGLMAVPEMVPAQVPGYWMPYFATTDPDAAATKAGGLGATVLMPGMDFPGGRFSVVQDPQGAVFGLLRLNTS